MGESRPAVEELMPQQEGIRRGNRVTDLNTTPRVYHPASPSSASVAASISAVMEERRRKSISFLYPDILFLHELCKLASREHKKVSSVTETVETFQIQWYSDKEWNNTVFMRFSFHAQIFLQSLPRCFSDWELQFLGHTQDMRRSHLCGQRFQEVAMLCLVLIELRWCVSTLWKTAQKRDLWGQMLQSMQHNVGGCSLEVEVLSRAHGSWWQLCVSGAWVLECGATAKRGLCTQTFL